MTSGPQKYILLVDDESIILNVLAHHLQRFVSEEYEVLKCMSGEEALKLVDQIQEEGGVIGCVVSDYLMHPMRGSDLLVALDAKIPNAKKILLTGQADLQAVAEVLTKIDLFRYITKPWEPKDLELTITEALRMFDNEIQLRLKNEELTRIKESLEVTVAERTSELSRKNSELEQGLEYARHIQECFLPDSSRASEYLKNLHIFNSPATSISGDFAWYRYQDNKVLFALGDSTGHGLGGALITVLATDILSEKTLKNGHEKELPTIVRDTISDLRGRLQTNHSFGELAVGIDLSLVRIDLATKEMEWASLNGSIIVIDENNHSQILSKSRGFFQTATYENNITSGQLNVANKKVILCSDGLYDQLNGDTGKRLKISGLIQAIEENRIFSNGICMIETVFNEWRNGTDQTDDAMWISFEV